MVSRFNFFWKVGAWGYSNRNVYDNLWFDGFTETRQARNGSAQAHPFFNVHFGYLSRLTSINPLSTFCGPSGLVSTHEDVMEICVSDAGRLQRLPKILKQKSASKGVELKLSTCRELVARMLGFKNWNLALANAVRSEKDIWDDQVPEMVALARKSQYARVLIEAGLDQSTAEAIVTTAAFTTRPSETVSHECIPTIFNNNWTQVWGPLGVDWTGREHPAGPYARRITNEKQARALGWNVDDLLFHVTDVTVVCLVVAFKQGRRFVPIGHVCYRQSLTPGAKHVVDVLSHYDVPLAEFEGENWPEFSCQAAIRSDLRDSSYWRRNALPQKGVEVVISPALSNWDKPSWALGLFYELEGLENDDYDQDEFPPLPCRFTSISFKDARENENRLPKIGALYCDGATASALEMLKGLQNGGFAFDPRPVLRVSPGDGQIQLLELVSGALVPYGTRKHSEGLEEYFGKKVSEFEAAMTEPVRRRMFEFESVPFFIFGRSMCDLVVIQEEKLALKDWGTGDRAFKRVILARDPKRKAFEIEYYIWLSLFASQLDRCFAVRGGKAVNEPEPLLLQKLPMDWEFSMETTEERAMQDQIGLSSGLWDLPFLTGRSLIVRPDSFLRESEVEKLDKVLKCAPGEAMYLVQRVRKEEHDSIFAAFRDLQECIDRGGVISAPLSGERTMLTVRGPAVSEPQGMVSYVRELHADSDPAVLRYCLNIEALASTRHETSDATVDALMYAVAREVLGDLEVLARQTRALSLNSEIFPDVYLLLKTDEALTLEDEAHFHLLREFMEQAAVSSFNKEEVVIRRQDLYHVEWHGGQFW
ncbi:hypothetical protein [Rhizobium sp. MHM7A]|uniref:hypothetical protein n=1 Tax=Rhizobium sp. MHM7A TaxID=2583233 RepID=UPI001106589A|nr:hypothetical protein [Rhizobium sp. MHM7A]TLX16064.1 hypothetical protein FFR93_01720 [Rhizobium sp. MHM7A]